MRVQDFLGFLCGQVAYEYMGGEAVGEGEQGASLVLRVGRRSAFVGRAALGGLRDEADEEVLEGRVAGSQRAGEWLADSGLSDEREPDRKPRIRASVPADGGLRPLRDPGTADTDTDDDDGAAG